MLEEEVVRLTGPALERTALQSGQSAEAQSMQLSSNEGWGTSGSPAARRLSLVPLQVDSKATLGLGGVAVVLGAVVASMGFFSYLGVPSSLVILQVVPFLVLAVGADNIFIFVLEYQVRGQKFCTPSAAPTHPGMAPWVCWVYSSLFLSTDVHVYNSCRIQCSVFIFHINAFVPHMSPELALS